ATMTTLTWPNPVSPGLWPFRVEVPADWTAVEPPDALIAFLGPNLAGFRPNLVIFGQRLPDRVTLADAVQETLRDSGAETIVDPGADRPGGPTARPVAVRAGRARYEGFDVCQLVAATEAPDRSTGGLRSVYTPVGSHLADQAAPDPPMLPTVMSPVQ